MNFATGIIVGAVGMLVLQIACLGLFALREFFKGFRKGVVENETAEEVNT